MLVGTGAPSRSENAAARTRKAVVSYYVTASRNEKVAALRDGLTEVACELVALGVPVHEIDRALDDAFSAAEEEHLSGAA